MPYHPITAFILSGLPFSIEKQGVRFLHQSISYLSGTHAVSGYLTRWALFDPTIGVEWAQKNPISFHASPLPKIRQKHVFTTRCTTDIPGHPSRCYPSTTRGPENEMLFYKTNQIDRPMKRQKQRNLRPKESKPPHIPACRKPCRNFTGEKHAEFTQQTEMRIPRKYDRPPALCSLK